MFLYEFRSLDPRSACTKTAFWMFGRKFLPYTASEMKPQVDIKSKISQDQGDIILYLARHKSVWTFCKSAVSHLGRESAFWELFRQECSVVTLKVERDESEKVTQAQVSRCDTFSALVDHPLYPPLPSFGSVGLGQMIHFCRSGIPALGCFVVKCASRVARASSPIRCRSPGRLLVSF